MFQFQMPRVNPAKKLKIDSNALKGAALDAIANAGINLPPQGAAKVGSALDRFAARVGGRNTSCEGRTPLMRRQALVFRLVNNGGTSGTRTGVSIAAGSAPLETLVANSNWLHSSQSSALAADLASEASRVLLQDSSSKGHSHYSMLDGGFIRHVRGRIVVSARRAGESVNAELSAEIKKALESNFAIVIDQTATGTDYRLAPTFFSQIPPEGVEMKDDQLFELTRNSVVRVDYAGVGSLVNYPAFDHDSGEQIYVAVAIEVELIVTKTPNEDYTDLL